MLTKSRKEKKQKNRYLNHIVKQPRSQVFSSSRPSEAREVGRVEVDSEGLSVLYNPTTLFTDNAAVGDLCCFTFFAFLLISVAML